MKVSASCAKAASNSSLVFGLKPSGSSMLTTRSVIANAKMPSVSASSLPFEMNSFVSCIIPPFSSERSQSAADQNDCHKRQKRADDPDHHDVEIALAMGIGRAHV